MGSDTLRGAVTSRDSPTYLSRLTRQLPTVDAYSGVLTTLNTVYAGGDTSNQ